MAVQYFQTKTYAFEFFSGSVHDTRVLYSSDLWKSWQVQKWRPFDGAMIAADCGYPPRCQWIVTPFAPIVNPSTELELRRVEFNKRLIPLRITVERALGQLKRRFKILSKPMTFDQPIDSAKMVQVCAMLHNFVLERQDEFDPSAEELDQNFEIDTDSQFHDNFERDQGREGLDQGPGMFTNEYLLDRYF